MLLWGLAAVVMGINAYFVVTYTQLLPASTLVWVTVGCFITLYLSLICYLLYKAVEFSNKPRYTV